MTDPSPRCMVQAKTLTRFTSFVTRVMLALLKTERCAEAISRMALRILIMASLLLAVTIIPAAAQSDLAVSARSASVFHWPWEVRRHRVHRPPRQGRRYRQPTRTVDCEQVRQDQQTLSTLAKDDPDRYKRRMRLLTPGQRATIADCLTEKP